MKFKEWFEKKLIVGAFPYTQNEQFSGVDYDIVINVSDEFYHKYHNHLINMVGIENFWFPMNECRKDVGLNSIYAAMVILHEAEISSKRVYLHCHAGINRSRAVQAAYHYMRTGEHYEPEIKRNSYLNSLLAMCHRGYLPPKVEMEKFLTELSTQLKETGMEGGLLDHCKIETIRNF